MTYLGVPVATETLRHLMLEHQVYGALFQQPEAVAESLGVC